MSAQCLVELVAAALPVEVVGFDEQVVFASWAVQDEVVDTDRVLDDAGTLWEQHSRNPKHATLLSTFGEPTARLKVQRAYKTVVKARLYQGVHVGFLPADVEELLQGIVLGGQVTVERGGGVMEDPHNPELSVPDP